MRYGSYLLNSFFNCFFSSYNSTLLLGSYIGRIECDLRWKNSPLVIASFGNVLGSSFNWVLGKYTRNLETKKWFPFPTNQLQKASFWFTKYGKWALLFAWLPVIGDPLTFIAGVVRLRFVPFLILVTIGKVSRYVLIIIGVDWIVN